MPTTNVHQAKTQLSKLIDAALKGEEVIIARDGVPAVRLVPVTAAPVRRAGRWAGKVRFLDPDWDKPDSEIERLFYESVIFPGGRPRARGRRGRTGNRVKAGPWPFFLSNVLLWLTVQPGKLEARTLQQIDASARLFLSVVSIWELEIKVQAGKLSLPTDLWDELPGLAIEVIAVLQSDAIRAARLPSTIAIRSIA